MAGLEPIRDLGLVHWLLRARDSGASGVLTVRPPLQDAIQVTFVGGRVRHIAPDLEVLAGAGDDPGALASALEVGRDMVGERMKTIAELRDGEYAFVDDAATASANSATGLPLEVDPAVAIYRSFDHPQCDTEQAAYLGKRWEERLRPGPSHGARIEALRSAWPADPVAGSIDRAQSITELAGGAPDALTLLRRVYAAVATGVAVLVDMAAAAEAAPAAQADPAQSAGLDLQAQLDAQAAAAVAGAPAPPPIAETPWNADEDLVVTSTPMPMAMAELPTATPSSLSVEELLEAAAKEDDPWIGVSAYPDVAERVVRRDARIRAGRAEERRTRSGVSQLIRPESEDVGLNLDLVDEGRTSTAHLLSKPHEAPEIAAAPAAPAPEPEPEPEPAPAAEAAPAAQPAAQAAPPAKRELTPPPAEPESEAAAPSAAAQAPRVLTAPGGGGAPAAPRVLTAPGAAPSAPGTAAPAAAPPTPRAVLTTPPPTTVETVRAQTPIPEAPAEDEPSEDDVTESEAEKLRALNDWLDRTSPHLQAEELYKAFGVAPDSERDEIVRKHRELVVQFHPDRFERYEIGDATNRLVTVWGKLNKAIVTLTDPTERNEYDIYIDRKRRGLPTDPEVVMRAESTYMDGERLLRAGRFKEAVAKYDEAISLNKADPEFHLARAWAHVQIAATAPGAGGLAPPALRDRARDACRAALKDIPRLDRAHYYLGMIAKMDNNPTEARAQFKKAVELNAHNVEAKRELRLLEMRGGAEGPQGPPPGGAGAAAAQPVPDGEEKGGLFGRFRKP